jgi:hypothetical protein
MVQQLHHHLLRQSIVQQMYRVGDYYGWADAISAVHKCRHESANATYSMRGPSPARACRSETTLGKSHGALMVGLDIRTDDVATLVDRVMTGVVGVGAEEEGTTSGAVNGITVGGGGVGIIRISDTMGIDGAAIVVAVGDVCC